MNNKKRAGKKAVKIGGVAAVIFLIALEIVNGSVTGFTSAIFSSINSKVSEITHQKAGIGPVQPPEHIQLPEVERLNKFAANTLKQMAAIHSRDQKNRELEYVFDLLRESSKLDPNDPETFFLYAEAYFQKDDLDTANTYLNKAKAQYKFKSDLYFADSFYMEKIGDQRSLDNKPSEADHFYSAAKTDLNKAMDELSLSFHTITEIRDSLSRVNKKLEHNRSVHAFLSYSLNTDTKKDDYINSAENIARRFSEFGLFRVSLLWYRFLYDQNTTGGQREQIMKNFLYVSDLWEFDTDFDFQQQISLGYVRFITDGNEELKQKQSFSDDDTIMVLQQFDEGTVLLRSAAKERKGNGTGEAYFYHIRTDDGVEGYLWGRHLFFYPQYPPGF